MDLRDIWLYIAKDNPEAADKLTPVLVSRFLVLASKRAMGRQRKELGSNLRSHVVGNYIIFYRCMNDEIEVVRVLHGARDLPPLF
jgi:toxin ParE1/3/4